ncbi:MAG: sigma-70 family RNA polymerase sigma factor, partial [Ilumatobacteraceae bacterium]
MRELSDAELIAGARKGDSDAYGELYRRHVDSARAAARALTRSRSDADDVTSEAFARVLRALQSGGGPDVSFRPYLVTAVRNVFYDKVRRNREEPTEDMSDEVNVALLDSAKSQEDGAFAAVAFATLPERWQLVLWHTEVEGRSVAEVAPMLGLAPNAVAALAYRAREGLRQAYLQAHLRDQQAAECRECAANLGAYVRDGLSARDRRRIDAHLDGCDSCKGLVAELADTNNTLRAALIPALIGVSSAAYLSGLGGKGLLATVTRMPKKQQAAAGGVVAACLVLFALVAGALGRSDGSAAVPSTSTTLAVAADGNGGNGSPVAPTPSTVPPTTVPPTTVPPTTVPPSSVPPVVTPTGTTTPSSATTVPVTAPAPTTPAPVVTRNTTRSTPSPTPAPTTPATPAPTTPPTRVPRTVPPIVTTPATTAPTSTVPATTLPATTTTAPPPPALTVVAVQRTAALK